MITTIYAAICALLLMKLAYRVIQLRRQYKVSLGDGGVLELEQAIAAHSNASQYIPIALILLFLLEYNSKNIWLVNMLAIIFVIGRFIHAWGIFHNLKARILGMQLTIYSIVFLAISNIIVIILR